MKRSNHVALTALFLVAISATAAKGQEVSGHPGQNGSGDSTKARSHNTGTNGGNANTGHRFLGLFHRHNNNTPKGGQTNAPRAAGFGNTLRTASS